ncbi:hypothetical protein ABW19_dt0201700 [Dactylella cylindrospora]|nr:hypothetical protein ABW19_dt0201700 [Dactylella cylindrospora]
MTTTPSTDTEYSFDLITPTSGVQQRTGLPLQVAVQHGFVRNNTPKNLQSSQMESSDIRFQISRPWPDLLKETLVGRDDLENLFEEEYDEGEPEPGDGFEKLFRTRQYADVDLYVGSDQKLIQAHRAILVEESTSFEKFFKEAEIPTSSIDMSTYNADVFLVILRYLYTTTIRHSKHPSFLAELFHQSLYLGVAVITRHVIWYLESNLRECLEGEEGISLPYVVTLVRGLQFRKHKDGNARISRILELLVENPDFDGWLDKPQFTKMLDEHPEVARIMLSHYQKMKKLKLEQEVKARGAEDAAVEKWTIQAAEAQEKLKSISEGLFVHKKTIDELKEGIDKLNDRYYKKLEKERKDLESLKKQLDEVLKL